MIPLHPTRPLVPSLAIALLALPALAQKMPDVRANANAGGTSFASQPVIAAEGDSIYLAWSDSRNSTMTVSTQDIYFQKSTDGGQTWLPADIRLDTDSALSLSVDPQIAVQGDNVYVTWSDYRNGGSVNSDVYFNASTDGGATWFASDVRLNTYPIHTTVPGKASRFPAISAQGDNVYVAWLDGRNGPAALDDIYFNVSNDAGTTWLGSDLRVDRAMGGTEKVLNPSICSAGSNVYVGWNDLRNGAFDVYMNYSHDFGASFAAQDVRVDTDPRLNTSQFVALACEGDRVYVAWWDNRNTYMQPGGTVVQDDDIYFNYSTDKGVTFQANDIRLDTNINNPPGSTKSNWPEIRVNGMDVYVVWEDWRNGVVAATTQADVYFNHSADGGATWLTDDMQISHVPTGPGPDHSPALPQMCVRGDDVYVAWVDIRNGASDVYFNRSTDKGATWLSFDVRLDTDGSGVAASNEARIACSGRGVFAVWSDDRIAIQQGTSGTDIFVNAPFGDWTYGAGLAGQGGQVPALDAGGQPTLGDVFSIDVSNGAGGAPGALLLGGQRTAIPLLGGTILTLPILVPPIFLDGAGGVSQPFRVPNREAFIGVPLFFQAVILDPAAPEGLSMTNGVEVWMG